jgi:hypothetical protein
MKDTPMFTTKEKAKPYPDFSKTSPTLDQWHWMTKNPPPPPFASVRVRVSPELASALLEEAKLDEWYNTIQRNIAAAKVETYANDMDGGAWLYNGLPILISLEGSLINGQGRLSACVLSAAAFDTAVAFGIDRATYHTLDVSASARMLADAFKAWRVPQYALAASIVMQVWLYRRHARGRAYLFNPSYGQLHELYTEMGGEATMRRILTIARKFGASYKFSQATMGAIYYEASCLDKDAAASFFGELATGHRAGTNKFVKKTSPVGKVHQKHDEYRLASPASPTLPMIVQAAYVIQAWNALRAGQTTVALDWRGKSNKERLPALQ